MAGSSHSTILACVVACFLAPGCTTPQQLRTNTVNQAKTVSDIYEQQVLDNVAKFVCNHHAMPHFMVATGGSEAINDQLTAGGNSSWTKGGVLSAAGLTLGAQRQQNDGWTTTPVSDPRKLQLMQCAYQLAISPCLRNPVYTNCADCNKLFNVFYTGDPNYVGGVGQARQDLESGKLHVTSPPQPKSPKKLASNALWETLSPATLAQFFTDAKAPSGPETSAAPPQQSLLDLYGVSTACLGNTGCWFHVCCDKCIAQYRGRSCWKSGHYCHVHVVVDDDHGQEVLTNLTMIILDFATYQGVAPQGITPADVAKLTAEHSAVVVKKNEIEQTALAVTESLAPQLRALQTNFQRARENHRLAVQATERMDVPNKNELRANVDIASGAMAKSERDLRLAEAPIRADVQAWEDLDNEQQRIENILSNIPVAGVQRQRDPLYAPNTFPFLPFSQQLNTLAPGVTR